MLAMKRLLLPLLLLVTGILPAPACLWDTDSLRDEALQKGSLYDFITGQFPHHGNGYYTARIQRLKALPALDFEQRNDLAAAHIRMEQWTEAEALLRVNLAEKPSDYFTLSNLGVLEKKRGRYAAAADWTAKALAIKPEGHLGLGDWYLKNLQYRTTTAGAAQSAPAKNFLGIDYATSFTPKRGDEPLPAAEAAEQSAAPEVIKRLELMLENDQTFADGFLVTGDFLAATGDLNLAFLCYKRAETLGHPNKPELEKRLRGLYAHFHEISYDGGGAKAYAAWMAKVKTKHDTEAANAFAGAATWLKQFQKTETALVAKHGDEKTTPAMVEAEMERQGIKRSRPRK